MKRFSPVLFVFLLALPMGCGKSSSTEKPAAQHHRRGSIEQEERLVERQAEQAKHDIDLLTNETETLLEKERNKERARIAKRSKKHSGDSAEYNEEILTEISEDAKDDAEDAPELVDLEQEQPSHRRLHKRIPVQENDEEIAPNQSDEDAQMTDESSDEAGTTEEVIETTDSDEAVEAAEDSSSEDSKLQL